MNKKVLLIVIIIALLLFPYVSKKYIKGDDIQTNLTNTQEKINEDFSLLDEGKDQKNVVEIKDDKVKSEDNNVNNAALPSTGMGR